MDRKVLKERKEYKVHKGLKELKALKVHKVHKVQLELKVHKVLKVQQVPKVQQVVRVLKVLKVLKVHKEDHIVDHLQNRQMVPLVLKEFKELLDSKEIQVPMVQLELKVQMEFKDSKVLEELWVLKDNQDLLVHQMLDLRKISHQLKGLLKKYLKYVVLDMFGEIIHLFLIEIKISQWMLEILRLFHFMKDIVEEEVEVKNHP